METQGCPNASRAQKRRHGFVHFSIHFRDMPIQNKWPNRNSRLFERRCFVWTRAHFLPLPFYRPTNLRKSDGFARTRRHFPKRTLFVIALVIFGRMPQPGIAKKNGFGRRGVQVLYWFPKCISPEAASEGAGATEVACAFPRFSKSGRFARTRRPVLMTRIHCKFQAPRSTRFASTKHLFVRRHKCKFTIFCPARCSA